MVETNKFFATAESFVASPETKEGVKIIGLALPSNKVSRNGFTYVTESISKASSTLAQKPVLFNHESTKPIGHVVKSEMQFDGLHYEMNIHPEAVNPETGVRFAESVARGDIPTVSIQCMYDEKKSFVDESGDTHAYIQEFLELSLVSIPGFADTTATVSESMKAQNEKAKTGTIKESVEVAPVPSQQDNDQSNTPDKDSDKKEPSEEPKADPMKEMADRLAKVEAMCTQMYQKFQKESEAEAPDHKEPDGDEDPKKETESKKLPSLTEDAKQKKIEEAIRKDKATVTPTAVGEQKKEYKDADLRSAMKEII